MTAPGPLPATPAGPAVGGALGHAGFLRGMRIREVQNPAPATSFVWRALL
jgi:hypothetical protein